MKTAKLSLLQIESRINSMFHTLQSGKLSGEWLRGEKQTLLKLLSARTASGKRRYSLYCEHYANGYFNALHNLVMQRDIEFCYVVDNIIYSTCKNSTHPNAEAFYSKGSNFMDSLARGFYWKDTDKFYT